jgi:tRNA A37 threonylcarbamoyladenosine biosynthesis protein TsaE
MYEVAESIEELKAKHPDAVIDDGETYYVVFIAENVAKLYRKPRDFDKIKEILAYGFFPSNILRQLAVFKETKAIEVVKRYKNAKGLLLEGPAGVGKTFACTYAIAELLRVYKVNNPLYISCITYRRSVWDRYPDADCYLIDDLNANIDSIELKLVEKIIYTAWNEKKHLFITTNTPFKSLQKILAEPIVSRIFSLCQYARIDDIDYRLQALHEL